MEMSNKTWQQALKCNNVYVLVESYGEREFYNETIIAVCSDKEEAENCMDEYYGGKFKLKKFDDIRESGIEWVKKGMSGGFGSMEVDVTLYEFTLNKI